MMRGGSYLCHRSYCRRCWVFARQDCQPRPSTGYVGFSGGGRSRRDGRSRCGPVVASRSVGVRACAFVNRTVGGVRRAGALRRQVPVAASVIGVERG